MILMDVSRFEIDLNYCNMFMETFSQSFENINPKNKYELSLNIKNFKQNKKQTNKA